MLKKIFACAITLFIQASDLDRIIPSEIKDDAFYAAIHKLAQTEAITTILEIGSSSGEGSTEAFATGISKNPHKPVLFCMELSKPRFKVLQDHYKTNPSVICCNVSSVPLESFPSEERVLSFMRTVNTSLRGFTEDEVIGWLRQDIDYVKNAEVIDHGIEWIQSTYGIETFDMVLIDGSEFTGEAEFALVYGAKFILLDDIRAFKNYNNYMKLLNDSSYELMEEDPYLRNGYAIFRRI